MAANDDANALKGFIEWLGLEGDEASEFFDSAMARKGHKKVSSWTDNDEKESGEKKNVFKLGEKKAGNGGPGFQYGG